MMMLIINNKEWSHPTSTGVNLGIITEEKVNQSLTNYSSNLLNEETTNISAGQKQLLTIARTILANPKILILDEPINGLDPQGIIDLNKLLKKLSNQGMSIIISSHILSELESLCNKFCFIKKHIKAKEESNKKFIEI